MPQRELADERPATIPCRLAPEKGRRGKFAKSNSAQIADGGDGEQAAAYSRNVTSRISSSQ